MPSTKLQDGWKRLEQGQIWPGNIVIQYPNMHFNSFGESKNNYFQIFESKSNPVKIVVPPSLSFHSHVVVVHMSFPCLKLWTHMLRSTQPWGPKPALAEPHFLLVVNQLQQTTKIIQEQLRELTLVHKCLYVIHCVMGKSNSKKVH